MNKLVVIHRNFKNLSTGGHYYLANTIQYLKREKLNMDVFNCDTVPIKAKNSRFFFIIYILKYFLKNRKGIFTFTNHNLYFYLLIPLFFSRLMGNKYGCGCHSTQYHLRKNLFMRWLEFLCEYLILQGASLLIIPSKAAIQQFKVFHIERKKIVVVNPAPNVVGQDEVLFHKQVSRILFTGYVEWRKGLDILIKAMGRLKDLDLHLDVAGLYKRNSSYFRAIQKIINGYQLADHVSFHGCLSPNELSTLYKEADLFVFPSRHETFGMVLVEAISFGLPVIASSIPTTASIIDNNTNGILYNIEDFEALALAIRKLTCDTDLRYAIMKNNIRLSKKLRTWDDVGRENYKAILPFLDRPQKKFLNSEQI